MLASHLVRSPRLCMDGTVALNRLGDFGLIGSDFVGAKSVDELDGGHIASAHDIVPDTIIDIAP